MTEYFDNSLYESVESTLSLMDCDIGPAECHGMLCGMLCATRGFDASSWLAHATGYQDPIHIDDLGRGHALNQLLEETIAGFDSDDFSLRMLLPDEEDSLEACALELGAWCRGFLSGFGVGESGDLSQLSDDSRDYLRDVQELGRIEPLVAETTEDEFSLLELCEYARMGALLLREETQFANAPAQGDETLH